MNLQEKKEQVEGLAKELATDSHLFMAEYRGMTVEQMSQLRKRVREASGKVKIVKNTFLRRAAEGTSKDVLSDQFQGPNAVMLCLDDPMPLIKVLVDTAKKEKVFSLKSAVVEGKAVSAEDLVRMAELPSREVLLARALASMNAPLQGLMNVCQGTTRDLLYALKAVGEAKSAAA